MGLSLSVVTNVGGALISLEIQGRNPNSVVGAAVVGTVGGYAIEARFENRLDKHFDQLIGNPFRLMFISAGIGLNITRFNTIGTISGMKSGVFYT